MRHEPVAVVLDLVNPVGAGRGLVGWGWEARLDEARPVGGQALAHTLDQHAANLGSRGEELNRNMGLFQGPATITTWMGLAPFGDLGRLNSLVLWAHKEVHSALS